MKLEVLEEIRKHFKYEVIEFDWTPVRRQPKRYGILYPIIGYIVSLFAIIFMGLGVFMWLFLTGGSILFFGGIYCANEIIGEYREIHKNSEGQNKILEGSDHAYPVCQMREENREATIL